MDTSKHSFLAASIHRGVQYADWLKVSSDPYVEWDSRSELSGLTALRGIAAVLVVAYHFEAVARAFGGVLYLGPFASLVQRGFVFVDLFFVLSGLVIAHVYAQRDIGQSLTSYRRFLGHRLARIYPLHLAVLSVLMLPTLSRLLNGASPWAGNNTPLSLVSELLLLDSIGLHDSLTWNEVSWSISAEWFAYLLSPPILLLARRGPNARLASVVALVGAWIALGVLWWSTPQDPTFDFGAVRGVLGFVVGVAVYRLHREEAVVRWARSKSSFLTPVVAIGVLASFPVNEALFIPLFVMLILTSIHSSGPLQELLQSPGLLWLGKISYSVYLVQSVFLLVLVNAAGKRGIATMNGLELWIVFLVWMGVLLAVSTMTYRAVEIPAQRYLRSRNSSQTKKPEHVESSK